MKHGRFILQVNACQSKPSLRFENIWKRTNWYATAHHVAIITKLKHKSIISCALWSTGATVSRRHGKPEPVHELGGTVARTSAAVGHLGSA